MSSKNIVAYQYLRSGKKFVEAVKKVTDKYSNPDLSEIAEAKLLANRWLNCCQQLIADKQDITDLADGKPTEKIPGYLLDFYGHDVDFSRLEPAQRRRLLALPLMVKWLKSKLEDFLQDIIVAEEMMNSSLDYDWCGAGTFSGINRRDEFGYFISQDGVVVLNNQHFDNFLYIFLYEGFADSKHVEKNEPAILKPVARVKATRASTPRIKHLAQIYFRRKGKDWSGHNQEFLVVTPLENFSVETELVPTIAKEISRVLTGYFKKTSNKK